MNNRKAKLLRKIARKMSSPTRYNYKDGLVYSTSSVHKPVVTIAGTYRNVYQKLKKLRISTDLERALNAKN